MAQQDISRSNIDLNFSLTKVNVLRKAIGLLGLAVLTAGVVGYLALASGFISTGFSLVAVLAVFGISFFVGNRQDDAMGYFLVILSGGLLGYAVVPTVAYFFAVGKAAVVAQAFISTFVLFTALYLYATITKKDFTNIGGFVAIAFIVLLVVMLLNVLIFHSAFLSVLLSYAVIVIVSAGILFKISLAVNGGQMSAVALSFGLLLDVYNIFVSLLNIFGSRD